MRVEGAVHHTAADTVWPGTRAPGRSETGLCFFPAEVLEHVVEFPLHSLCNIIFSICCCFCQVTYSSCGLVSKGCSQVPKSYVHTDQFTNSCAPSSSMLGPTFRVLARTGALNNRGKGSGDFRESAGLGLRGRKMCVAGQVREANSEMEIGVQYIYGE